MSTLERGLHSRHLRDGTSRNRDNSIFYDTMSCVERPQRTRNYPHKKQSRQNHGARAQTSYSFYQDDRRPDRYAHQRTSYTIHSDSDDSYTYSELDDRSDNENYEAPQPDRTMHYNKDFKAFCTEIAQYVVEACTRSAIQSSSMYADTASSILSASFDDGMDDRAPVSSKGHANSRRGLRHGEFARNSRQTKSQDKLQSITEVFSGSHRGTHYSKGRDNTHHNGRYIYQQNPLAAPIAKRGVAQLESSPLRTQHSAARSPNAKVLGDDRNDSINSPRELQTRTFKRSRPDKQGSEATIRRLIVEPFPVELPDSQHAISHHASQKVKRSQPTSAQLESQTVVFGTEGNNIHSVDSSVSDNNDSFVSDSHTDSSAYYNREDGLNHAPMKKLSSNMKEDNNATQIAVAAANAFSCISEGREKKASKKQSLIDIRVVSSHLPLDSDIKAAASQKGGIKEAPVHDGLVPCVSTDQQLAAIGGSSLYNELRSVNFSKQAISVRLVEISNDFRRYKSEIAKQFAELQATVTSMSTQIKMLECTINGLQIGVHAQPSFARGSGIFWNDSLIHKDHSAAVGRSSGTGANSVMQYPKIISTPLIDPTRSSCSSAQMVSRSPEPLDVMRSENKPPMVPSLHAGTTDVTGRCDLRNYVLSTDGQSESVHDSVSSQTELNSLSIVQMGDEKMSVLTASQISKGKKRKHHTSSKCDSEGGIGVTISPLSTTAEAVDRKSGLSDMAAPSTRKHARSSIQDFIKETSSTREKSPSRNPSLCQNSTASYVEDMDIHVGDSAAIGPEGPVSGISTDDPERTGDTKSTSRRSHRAGGIEFSDRGDPQDQTGCMSTYEASDTHKSSKSKPRERRQRKSKSHSGSARDYQGQLNEEASHSQSILSERLGPVNILGTNMMQPELEVPLNQNDTPIHPYLLSHPDSAEHAATLDPSNYGLTEKLFVSDLSRSPSIFNDDTELMIVETIEIVQSIYILPGLKNNKLTTWSAACRTLGNLMINTDGPFWKATYQCARYLLALYVAYGSAVLEAGLSEIYQRFYTALKTMTGVGNEEIQADCLLVASVLDLICGVTQLRQEGDLSRLVSSIATVAPSLSQVGFAAHVFPLPVCLLVVMEELISEEQFQLVNTWIRSDQEPQDDEQKRIAEFAIYFSTYFYSMMSYVTDFYVIITGHSKKPDEPLALDNPVSAGVLCNLASLYRAGILLQENLLSPEGSFEANSLKLGLKQLINLVPEIGEIIIRAEKK
ncbi:Hypothetical protein GLP15_37 [Giardia lamblia P15]|uniref:Uncharacterized protein n=1 Tax=Giardia intestinalis (strain P15) TaxID=658858 RepID=E1F0Q1_GIAIA|nr:Hypothetical protein GLP15_37 [Giardia lamblia P15]